VLKVTTNVHSAVFRLSHRPTIILLLVYCRIDYTLFEVAQKSAV